MRARGFTLIELLVAVALTVMLVSVMALLFFRSTDVVMAGEARMSVAANARLTLDAVERDLENAFPTAAGQQRFVLTDGYDTAGPDRDVAGAHDSIGVVTTAMATVGGTRVRCSAFVEMYLAPEPDFSVGAEGAVASGIRSGRELRVLKRRVWRVERDTAYALLAGLKDGVPLDPAAATAAGMTLLEEGELCHFVLSFNVEVFANETYFQVHEGGGNPYTAGFYPLGDDAADPGLPRKVRLTLRVIEGAAERTERCAQREVWLPLE